MSFRASAFTKSRQQIPQYYSNEFDSFEDDWRNDPYERQRLVESFKGYDDPDIPTQRYSKVGNQLCFLSKKIRKESPQQKFGPYNYEKAKIFQQKAALRNLLEEVDGEKKITTKAFHKTRMCPFLKTNSCKRGDECTFAHSRAELREPPNLEKTKMCQMFLTGKCYNGKNCKFAHSEAELRSTPEFYKASLCIAYQMGNCEMGSLCRFAHGIEELSTIDKSFLSPKRSTGKSSVVYQEEQNTPTIDSPGNSSMGDFPCEDGGFADDVSFGPNKADQNISDNEEFGILGIKSQQDKENTDPNGHNPFLRRLNATGASAYIVSDEVYSIDASPEKQRNIYEYESPSFKAAWNRS